MFGFFKTKAGVFVLCMAIFFMACGLYLVSRKGKGTTPAPVVATPSQPATAPASVANPNQLPDTIANVSASTDQRKEQNKDDQKKSTSKTEVKVVHRQVASAPSAVRPKGDAGMSQQEANYHETVRLTPLPRRQSEPPVSTPAPVASHPEAPAYAPVQFGAAVQHPGAVSDTDPAMRYAPYGRLIKCELVITVDSTNAETPIVALVTEDQYWNGELILPAGAEVHGRGKVDRQRDRIFSDQKWVVVLPRQGKAAHGRELVINAEALDRDDPAGDGRTWGITDGSFGLRGYTIRSQSAEEIKLFASSFLASAAGGLQDTSSSAFGGVQPKATAKNAGLAGAQSVLNRYSDQLLAEIQKNGSYTRVPAGKQFYLYVTETLAPDRAAVAGSAGVSHDATVDQTRIRVPTMETKK